MLGIYLFLVEPQQSLHKTHIQTFPSVWKTKHVQVFSLFLSVPHVCAHTDTPIDTQLTGNQMPLFVKFHFSSHELIKEAAIDSAALKERAI